MTLAPVECARTAPLLIAIMFDVWRTDDAVSGTAREAHGPNWRVLGLMCLLFCTAVTLAQLVEGLRGGWMLQRAAFQQGSWWQPLSAQWVHLNWRHAVVNMAGFCAVALVFAGRLPLRSSVVVLGASMAAVALLLALDDACAYYAGSSGALYGWLAGGGLLLAMGANSVSDQRTRLIGLGCTLWPVLRAGWQMWGPVSGQLATGLDIAVYSPVHMAGIVGGGIGGGLVLWHARSRRSQIAPGVKAYSQE